MSGVTGVPSDYGVFTSLVQDGATVRQRLDQLTTQAATGLVAQTYGGLGAGASTAITLAPQIANLQTLQSGISAATGQMQVAQTAMSQIQQIASNINAALPDLNGMQPSEVDDIAAQARDALQQVAGLLNTQDGGIYVFAGADTANPPVPNPSSILSSGFYTQIASAVGALGSAGATATATAIQTAAASNAAGTSPFSSYLSQPATTLLSQAPIVQTGPGQSEVYGFLASANTASVSSGTYSTGSYMRDLMGALATIGSLSSSQVNLTGFGSLVQDTGAVLSGAIGAMADDAGVLGNRQAALTATQSTLSATQTTLTAQVSGVNTVVAVAGPDAAAGVLPGDRQSRYAFAGEIPASMTGFTRY